MSTLGAIDLWLMGVRFQVSGQYNEALVAFDMALKKDSTHVHSWVSKAQVLDKLGRKGEAVMCFDKALEIDPREATAWLGKGLTLRGLGRHEEAAGCFHKAMELEPSIRNTVERFLGGK